MDSKEKILMHFTEALRLIEAEGLQGSNETTSIEKRSLWDMYIDVRALRNRYAYRFNLDDEVIYAPWYVANSDYIINALLNIWRYKYAQEQYVRIPALGLPPVDTEYIEGILRACDVDIVAQKNEIDYLVNGFQPNQRVVVNRDITNEMLGLRFGTKVVRIKKGSTGTFRDRGPVFRNDNKLDINVYFDSAEFIRGELWSINHAWVSPLTEENMLPIQPEEVGRTCSGCLESVGDEDMCPDCDLCYSCCECDASSDDYDDDWDEYDDDGYSDDDQDWDDNPF